MSRRDEPPGFAVTGPAPAAPWVLIFDAPAGPAHARALRARLRTIGHLAGLPEETVQAVLVSLTEAICLPVAAGAARPDEHAVRVYRRDSGPWLEFAVEGRRIGWREARSDSTEVRLIRGLAHSVRFDDTGHDGRLVVGWRIG